MSVAEISEQLNLTSIKDHGWHIQVRRSFYCALSVVAATEGKKIP